LGGFRRRGHALTFVAVTVIPLLGFAALAIDGGMLYSVRAELQRTADAAALAGAQALVTDSMLARNDSEVAQDAYNRASLVAGLNPVLKCPAHLPPADLRLGIITEPTNLSSPFRTSAPLQANAVSATARRTDESIDGPVPLFFAAVFGRNYSSLIGTATAVVDDHFAGYRPPTNSPVGGTLIPFTVRRSVYDDQTVNGQDLYCYDNGMVKPVGDRIPEVHLYTNRENQWDLQPDTDENFGGGNFGVVDVGNKGTAASFTAAQITNGISRDDLIAEIGTPEIRFYSDEGSPLTYTMTGTSGTMSSMEDEIAARVGQIVGFFVHDYMIDTGTNCLYTLVGIRFGRLMDVDLHGKNVDKSMWIQPVAYSGSDIITDADAPPTGKYTCRIYLAR